MFGQKCLVLPERNAVVAINAAIPSERHQLLLPTIFDALLGRCNDRQALETEGRAARAKAAATPLAASLCPDNWDKLKGAWVVAPNPDGLTGLSVSASDDEGILAFTDSRGTNTLVAGRSHWTASTTSITTYSLHHSYQETAAKVTAAATWLNPNTVLIECYFVETPFHDSIRISFEENGSLSIDWRVNVNSGPTARPRFHATRVGKTRQRE